MSTTTTATAVLGELVAWAGQDDHLEILDTPGMADAWLVRIVAAAREVVTKNESRPFRRLSTALELLDSGQSGPVFHIHVKLAKLAQLERIAAYLEVMVPPPPTWVTKTPAEATAEAPALARAWSRQEIELAKASGVSSDRLKAEADELQVKILEHVRRRGLDPARATVQLEQSPADGGWFLKISGPLLDEDGKF